MNFRKRLLPGILVLGGLACITGLIVYFGAGQVLKSFTSVSLLGFAEYVASQLTITLGLAWCWRVLLRSRMHGSFWLLFWGRLVRDAAGEFLPFSQVGGYVLGARVVSLGGVDPADATASTFADITTEFMGQLTFIGTGLVLLAWMAPSNALLLPIGIGLAVASLMSVGLVMVQRGDAGKLRRLVLRFRGRAGEKAAQKIEALQSSLDKVYASPKRLAWAAILHLICWFGTATASYIGFHALGVDITYKDAVIIESMLHAIMALAFFIPGRVGIQEAAYTVLAAIFGIPADVAISLSLLRRARDFVIAVPVLIAWQGLEAKHLRRTV